MERILLVEDSPTQAAELKYILEKNGYPTKLAVNGRVALNLLEHFTPEIILSDIRMPELDGLDLCRIVKKDPLLNSIPVILLTSLSSSKDVIEAISAGADYYFPKNYSTDYTINKINEIFSAPPSKRTFASADPMKISSEGQTYYIEAGREKLINLLLSTYKIATIQNMEIQKAQLELKRLNENLEETVNERTSQLTLESEERKKIEKQLMQAQKMEAVGQLTSGIAHDFNNILQVILGYGEIMKDYLPDDQNCRDAMSHIMHAGEQAMGIVRQLLTFSKKTEPRRLELRVKDTLDQIVVLSGRIIGSHISFVTQYEENLPVLSADPTLLEQAFLNLFINARDAMPQGGEIKISVFMSSQEMAVKFGASPESKTKYIAFEVSDSGNGISADHLKRIFDPFFTTKEVGKGTGLGLATVYASVKKHNGFISVRSKIGAGTTFSFLLPVVAPEEVPEIVMQKNLKLSDLKGVENVFVAEDESVIQKFISHLLSMNGYKVVIADNGLKAIEILEKDLDKFDLLILDVIMPGKTGRDVADFARKKNKKVPILFSTGFSEDLLQGDFLTRINADIIHKPFTPIELLRKVRKALNGNKN
jgi:signal transduction histidine kinase